MIFKLKADELIRDTPLPAFIITKDHKISHVNEPFCRFLGKSKEEIEGKFCFELVHQEGKVPSLCPLKSGEVCFLSGCSGLFSQGCGLCPQVCDENQELSEKAHARGYYSREFYEPKLQRYLRVTLIPLFNEKEELYGYLHFIEEQTEKFEIFKFLELVVDHYPGLLFVVDENFQIIYMNQRVRELNFQEGARCHYLIFGKAEPCEDCFFLGRGPAEGSIVYSPISRRFLSKTFCYLSGLTGKRYKVAFYQDVTEPVRVFEEATVALVVTTPNGEILKYNQRARELFKLKEPPLRHYRAQDFWVNSGERDRYLETLNREGAVYNYETTLKNLQGEPFFALISSKIYKEEDKVFIYSSILDITSYIKIKNEVFRFIQQVLEFLPVGVAVIDEHDRVIFANQRFLSLTGYTLEELKASKLHQLMIADPLLKEAAQRVFEEISKGRRSYLSKKRIELLAKRKEGTLFPAEIVFDEIYLDGKRLFIGAVQDITERKIFEERLLREEKEFVIEKIAGGLAHDLNNILMILKGYLELLNSSIKNYGAKEKLYMEKVLLAFDRMKNLISELFILSKGEWQTTEITDASNFLMTWVPFFLQGTAIKLNLHIEQGLQLFIKESHLLSLVQNVVINAKEAMENIGELTVCAYKSGDVVIIEFLDTGPGIPPEIQPKVFEPGFSTKAYGSGLGLFVVKRLMEMYRGKIEIYSELGRGTKVVLKFPQPEGYFKEAEAEIHRDQIISEPPKKKILILDDEEDIRGVLHEFLLEQGFEVEIATNGDEAFNKIKEALDISKPFTHLLLDLTVPQGKGGVYLLKRLTEENINPENYKVIFMTGFTEREIREEAGDLKVDHILFKPFSLSKLLELI